MEEEWSVLNTALHGPFGYVAIPTTTDIGLIKQFITRISAFTLRHGPHWGVDTWIDKFKVYSEGLALDAKADLLSKLVVLSAPTQTPNPKPNPPIPTPAIDLTSTMDVFKHHTLK
jgi:hypothetical protein